MPYSPWPDLTPNELEQRQLAVWKEERLFQQTVDARRSGPPFVFYEGPPTANGRPGIHHVFSRTIKDLVCRFNVRKAGFDVGDIEGVLKGTVEGSQFEGRGPVKVVMKGKKRKHQHNHHGRDHDNRGHGGWHSRRD